MKKEVLLNKYRKRTVFYFFLLTKSIPFCSCFRKRQNDRIDPIRSTFGTLEKEEVDMDEKWIYVESCIKRKRHVSFRELLGAGHTKMQMVITFLVILELMKMGKISIVQEHTFDDIKIESRRAAS